MTHEIISRVLGAPLRQLNSTTLLPFLYQTRTLRPELHHAGSLRPPRSFRTFSTPGRSNPEPRDYDGFDPDVLVKPKSRKSSWESTLTPTERATFERIYKDIEQSASSTLHHEPEEYILEDEELDFSEEESLEDIFSNAISSSNDIRRIRFGGLTNSETLNEMSTAKTIYSSAPGIPNSEVSEKDVVKGKAQDGMIEEARRKDTEEFEYRLSSYKSDVDVWRVMQSHVLTKMQALTQLLHDEHSKKKGRKKKSAEKIVRQTKSQTADLTASTLLASTQTKQTPSMFHLLSVLRTNYAPQCLACLNTLRLRFPCSPYTLALLPEIKALGPISYVLGASTELYNELLFIRWVHYKDLHGCADLVEEMLDRSVATDARTRAVFNAARRTREQAQFLWAEMNNTEDAHLNEKFSTISEQDAPSSPLSRDTAMRPVAAAWWFLQGAESGWERWQTAEQHAFAEFHEQKRRARTNALTAVSEEEYERAIEDEEDGGPDIAIVSGDVPCGIEEEFVESRGKMAVPSSYVGKS